MNESIHPDTEFFSQGILSISLWPDYWAEVLRPGVMRSSDSILWSSSSTEPRTPKQTPSFLCSRLARRWSLNLGSGDTGPAAQWRQPGQARVRHQGWVMSPARPASHWSAGAILASDWLPGWTPAPLPVPDPRWEEIGQRWDAAGDNKISPSGRECNAYSTQYTRLYCTVLGKIPWMLLQIFMASLNTDTMCYNQLYLLWWGPNAKWSGAGLQEGGD